MKYQQGEAPGPLLGCIHGMALEERSHQVLMQTCDLRETGSSGYKGVEDKEARHPRVDITAEEQSKGWKEEEGPPNQ